MNNITTSIVGLERLSVFVAHELGGWGPESPKSDYHKHCLVRQLGKDGVLTITNDFLKPREEFKLVVPGLSIVEAVVIYEQRLAARVHRGMRFDYDRKSRCLWLLADGYDVVRLDEWNQNNIVSLPT